MAPRRRPGTAGPARRRGREPRLRAHGILSPGIQAEQQNPSQGPTQRLLCRLSREPLPATSPGGEGTAKESRAGAAEMCCTQDSKRGWSGQPGQCSLPLPLPSLHLTPDTALPRSASPAPVRQSLPLLPPLLGTLMQRVLSVSFLTMVTATPLVRQHRYQPLKGLSPMLVHLPAGLSPIRSFLGRTWRLRPNPPLTFPSDSTQALLGGAQSCGCFFNLKIPVEHT